MAEQRAALAGEDPDADVAAARAAAEEAGTRLGDLRGTIETMQARKAELQAARDTASSQLAGARAELSGVQREWEALKRDRDARERAAAKRSGRQQAIDGVRAAKGYERAVAAALGRAHAVDRLMAPAALRGGAFACIAIALECLPFALHAGQFRLGFGEFGRGGIARGLEFRLARLHRFERVAQFGQLRARALCSSARGDNIGRGILVRQRGAPFGHPPPFRLDPVEPAARLRDRGFGHAPFGFDPGIVCGRAGQREFGGAAVAFGLLMRAFERGALFFVARQRLFALGQFAFEPRQRFGGIAGCLLYTSPSPRDRTRSRMPSSA